MDHSVDQEQQQQFFYKAPHRVNKEKNIQGLPRETSEQFTKVYLPDYELDLAKATKFGNIEAWFSV